MIGVERYDHLHTKALLYLLDDLLAWCGGFLTDVYALHVCPSRMIDMNSNDGRFGSSKDDLVLKALKCSGHE